MDKTCPFLSRSHQFTFAVRLQTHQTHVDRSYLKQEQVIIVQW